MNITFYGAAGGVTGSKHLIEFENKRVLLDCGTFQGLPDVRARNRSLPFVPEAINAVILSHAHIDHCGMLPLLVKRGFTGQIYATEATKNVAKLMLMDSAGIEEQDSAYRAKHHLGPPDARVPLFTPDDIPPVLDRFVNVPYQRDSDSWHTVLAGLKLKMYDAGHILGSAVSVLKFTTGKSSFNLCYTGDIGAPHTPLLPDATVPNEPISTLIIESTYGNRSHQPFTQALERLAQIINQVVKRKGKIIIPAFSLGRTQAIVYLLHKLTDDKRIPRLPIIVDSPLATKLTEVFRDNRKHYDVEAEADFSGTNHQPLDFSNLSYTHTISESKELNSAKGPFIVISASGMMTAGRVVHHLRHHIRDPKNVVLITGYQAQGTLGRRLLEGAKNVELYGDWFSVKAEIKVFNEFSAHADQQELINFINQFKKLQRVILVHGEAKQADQLKAKLEILHSDWQIDRPNEGDTISI